MSYRCRICNDVSQPGQPRLVHVVEREVPNGILLPRRREIAEEVPVCVNCHKQLADGASLAQLLRLHREALRPTPVAPKPQRITF